MTEIKAGNERKGESKSRVEISPYYYASMPSPSEVMEAEELQGVIGIIGGSAVSSAGEDDNGIIPLKIVRFRRWRPANAVSCLTSK